MSRLIKSKWLIAGLFASSIIVAGIGAIVSAPPAERLGVPECVNCTTEDFRLSAIPVERPRQTTRCSG